MNEIFQIFIMLFAVIDPIGTVPVFIEVTKKHNEIEKRRIAIKAIFVSACVLVFFAVVGQLLLEAINVPLSAFGISGGVIVFLYALSMIFGDSKPENEIQELKKGNDIAIFPLAIPSIAGPASMMAIVMLTDNHRFSISHQVLAVSLMLIVLMITLILLLSSNRLYKLIGDSGASVISRVMGLILASIATNSIIEGIKSCFNL